MALRNIVALRGVVLQQVRKHLGGSQVVDSDDFVALDVYKRQAHGRQNRLLFVFPDAGGKTFDHRSDTSISCVDVYKRQHQAHEDLHGIGDHAGPAARTSASAA